MKKLISKGLILGVFIAIFLIFRSYDLGTYLTFDSLKQNQESLKESYTHSPLIFIGAYMGVYILSTALSLPGATILTLAGGALFGFPLGLLLVSFASTLGATCAFLVARFILRDSIQSKFKDKLKTINKGIEREGAFYLFTMRLIPVFPFFVVNLVMALTPIKTITFYWVSQLGFLFLAFYVWIFWVTRRTAVLPEAAFFILGGVLIFSPVLDPWYLVWILPLAVLFRSPAWLFLSFFVWGAYAWYLFEGLPGRWDKGWGPVARMIEYGGFYGILLWQGWFRRNMRPRELAGSAARV